MVSIRDPADSPSTGWCCDFHTTDVRRHEHFRVGCHAKWCDSIADLASRCEDSTDDYLAVWVEDAVWTDGWTRRYRVVFYDAQLQLFMLECGSALDVRGRRWCYTIPDHQPYHLVERSSSSSQDYDEWDEDGHSVEFALSSRNGTDDDDDAASSGAREDTLTDVVVHA